MAFLCLKLIDSGYGLYGTLVIDRDCTMNKFSATSNAKAMPSYLAGVGKRVQDSREAQAEGAKLVESKKQVQAGRMTVAQFKSQFPKAIDHGHGNFEDGQTGSIWEVHDGCIVRRADSSIRDVLKAINDHPEMSDDEYYKLINSMNSERRVGA